MEWPAVLGTAFLVAFVAELGDKSQLILFGQATRAKPVRVILEAVAAFAILTALAVTVGAAVARWIPPLVAALASALLFFTFAALAWRDARKPATDQEPPARGTFLLILVSEFGDRTQIVTAALAVSSGNALATGIGAWLALALSSVLAVLAGRWLGHRVDPRRRAIFSAILFAVLGVVALGWGLWPLRA